MLKKHFLPFCLAFIAIMMLNSCRKGEGDPWLSLRSRKARLAGEWQLKEGYENYTLPTGNVQFEYSNNQATVNNNSYPYEETLVFDKDGTYKWVKDENGKVTTEKGSWEFGRKNDNKGFKSKETINLFVTEITVESGGAAETETYTGDYIPLGGYHDYKFLRLYELSSSKLVIIAEGSYYYDEEIVEYQMEKEFK